MGITYKAFDIDLRRLAALKVISPRYLADQGARSRFLRGARAAGSVRHLNVASVFQLGASQKNYFYAMEFVEGETLGSLIKRSTASMLSWLWKSLRRLLRDWRQSTNRSSFIAISNRAILWLARQQMALCQYVLSI
jgi:serine/threonine protein kinase